MTGRNPIRRWHVSLVSDLRSGKDVASEAAIAIENLEDLLFAAETELDQRDKPPKLFGWGDNIPPEFRR